MVFSSEKETTRQLALLDLVRKRHHERLVSKGIARRIIDADVPANYRGYTGPINEDTLLFASRQKLGQIAIEILLGDPTTSIAASCSRVSDMRAYVESHQLDDAILLNRIDATENGRSRSHFWVGLQEAGIEKRLSERLTPFDGIKVADLNVMVGMINELESLRVSGELSCLTEEGIINST